MKILVLDDEVSLKEIYLNFLAKVDGTADFFDHPQKGWQAIEKEEYDLIITDLKMPIISGDEFISIVRSSKLNAHTPIILCSGHINKLVMTEMARESKIYFLPKPFDSQTLLDLVKKAVSLKQVGVSLDRGINELWLQSFSEKLSSISDSAVTPVSLESFELWNFETMSLNFAVVKKEDQLNVTLVMKSKTFLKIAGKIQGTQYKDIETEALHVWQKLLVSVMKGSGRVTFSKLLSQEFLTLPGQRTSFYKFNTSFGEVLAYLN